MTSFPSCVERLTRGLPHQRRVARSKEPPSSPPVWHLQGLVSELTAGFLVLEQILQDDWVLALILAADAQMPNHHLDKGCALGEVCGVHCLSAPRTNGTVVDQSLLNAGMTHQVITVELHWSINNSLADDANYICLQYM